MNSLRVKRYTAQRFLMMLISCAYQWKSVFLGKGFSSGSSGDL